MGLDIIRRYVAWGVSVVGLREIGQGFRRPRRPEKGQEWFSDRLRALLKRSLPTIPVPLPRPCPSDPQTLPSGSGISRATAGDSHKRCSLARETPEPEAWTATSCCKMQHHARGEVWKVGRRAAKCSTTAACE